MGPEAFSETSKHAQSLNAASGRQRVVVVLGAGRSGTSAITRALPALGIDLGNRLRRGRGKNPTGFFEDIDLLAINKRLKRALGIQGDSVRLIDDAAWKAPAVRELHEEAVATIRRRFGGSKLWGYKYGRTLRMLPFWRGVYRALELDVAYVVALRNPLSVAHSREQLDRFRGTQEKSDLEWLVNVVPYFEYVRETTFVAVDYDRVMTAPEQQIERIAGALSLVVDEERHAAVRAYAKEFLEPGRRHSLYTVEHLARNPDVHPLVRDAYTWLHRLAADEVMCDSPDLWNDWARIRASLEALSPLLLHIDRVEDRVNAVLS